MLKRANKILFNNRIKETEDDISLSRAAEDNLWAAAREVELARRLFQQVDTPELTDYAIYSLKAAELRYNSLLQEYRQQFGHTSTEQKRCCRGGEC